MLVSEFATGLMRADRGQGAVERGKIGGVDLGHQIPPAVGRVDAADIGHPLQRRDDGVHVGGAEFDRDDGAHRPRPSASLPRRMVKPSSTPVAHQPVDAVLHRARARPRAAWRAWRSAACRRRASRPISRRSVSSRPVAAVSPEFLPQMPGSWPSLTYCKLYLLAGLHDTCPRSEVCSRRRPPCSRDCDPRRRWPR